VKVFRSKKNNSKTSNFLLNLRNKKYVRTNSLDRKLIKIEDHKKWLNSYLKNKKNKIFIIKINQKYIGYFRLQKKNSYYETSWAILEKFRGKKIISKFLKKVTTNSKVNYRATIRRQNIASIKAALNAGFVIKRKVKSLIYMHK
tara:strand:- start:812 stop:1243 length:432 start_codon:yes stop_codon:yes gene_type:complete